MQFSEMSADEQKFKPSAFDNTFGTYPVAWRAILVFETVKSREKSTQLRRAISRSESTFHSRNFQVEAEVSELPFDKKQVGVCRPAGNALRSLCGLEFSREDRRTAK